MKGRETEYLACRVWLSLCLLVLCSCASRREQLERVAKDWCETIRASQVIPVYPLSGDIVPGDVYLVDTTVSHQADEFRKRGYLPMPLRLGRISASGWQSYYAKFIKELADDAMPGVIAGNRRDSEESYARAPLAVFPTYSFSVTEKRGVEAAIPLGGIGVGLGAIGAGVSTGTVSLKDVRTYGLDAVSLSGDVREWARHEGVKELLINARKLADAENGFALWPPRKWLGTLAKKRSVYVRVVSRVYIVRALEVSLTGQSTSASTAAMSPLPGSFVDEMKFGASHFPKITASFAMASARGVSLVEVLPEPVVVGYEGFDMAVSADGRLGPPVPTFAVLADSVEPPLEWMGSLTRAEYEIAKWLEFLSSLQKDQASDIYREAAVRMGKVAEEKYTLAYNVGQDAREAWNAVIQHFTSEDGLSATIREQRWQRLCDAIQEAFFEVFRTEGT